jgi:hypothetical protein
MPLDVDSLPAAKRMAAYAYIRELEEMGIPEEDTLKILAGEMSIGFAYGKKIAREAIKDGFYSDIRFFLQNPPLPNIPEGIYYFIDCWKTATGVDVLKLCF